MNGGRIVRGIVFTAIPLFACQACGGDADSSNTKSDDRTVRSDAPRGHVIAPERRLKDYKEHLKYPPFNRPAHADTPDLDNWPGYKGRRIADAGILKFTGNERRAGSLHVAFQVHVKKSGRYTFDTLLLDKSGNKIATSSLTRDLKPGIQKLEFLFYGKIMRDAKAGGVFQLKGINGQRVLSDHELDLMGRAELKNSPEGILNPLRENYTTRSYTAGGFTNQDWQSAAKADRLKRIKKEIRDKQKRK